MLNFCWNLELLELKYFGNAKVSFLCGNNSKKVPAGGLWPEARGRRTSSATVNRRLAGPEAGVAVPPADNDSSRRPSRYWPKPAVLFPPAVLKDGAAGPQPCGPKAGLEAGPSGRAAIN